MKRLLVFFVSSLLLLVFNLPSVYACSYGDIPPPTVDTMLQTDVLVRGIVIENSGGNSIIEVQRYLLGSGSRYILLSRQSPSFYVSAHVRGYDYGCGYAASEVASVGTSAYFSLGYWSNGSYDISYLEQQSMFSIVDDADGQHVSYWENVDGTPEARTASLDEFEAMIAERTGKPGTSPVSSQMPRLRVLTIQTESGQNYMLPIDRDEVHPVPSFEPCTENCPIISPDGSHYLNPIPNESNAYWAWYQSRAADDDWTDGIGEGEGLHYPPQFHAQAVLFSPDSDYLLVWYEGSISLYAFNTWRDSGFYGYLPTLEEVWSAQLALTENMTAESFRGLAAWSGNSNAFAYWDADGLKWLDINTMRVPRLILQHETASIQSFAALNTTAVIPPLLELSSTGRYIRYGDSQEWTLLDVLTGMKYDDTLVNPDETRFAMIAPEETVGITVRSQEGEEGDCIMFDLQGNCLMTNERPFDYCILPMTTCSGYVSLYDYQVREIYWQDNSNLVYLACENSTSNLCFVMQENFERPYYAYRAPESFATNAFAYDEHYGYSAWATDDYYLSLSTSPYGDPLDLSGVLDSPIVSLEWGRPLWYQGEE